MQSEQRSDVEYLTSENMKALPFSEAVRLGNVLYLSGQMGIDQAMYLLPGGIAAETRQALENIKNTLEKYGSSLEHVIKVTVMLAEMSEWGQVNKVYLECCSKNLPAHNAFGAGGLALGERVEI